MPLIKGALASNPALTDKFGREITYLRLALTDRCDFRCRYCMPAEGIDLLPNTQLLTYEEILRLLAIFAGLGIRKMRLTGGEPMIRRNAIDFIRQILRANTISKVHITTNGARIDAHLSELKNLGLSGINFSLDTLDAHSFSEITRRDKFDDTWRSITNSINLNIPTKINMVVMAGINDNEIEDFARLSADWPVEIRFIEQMPFNGNGKKTDFYSAGKIEEVLKSKFPEIRHSPSATSIARRYKIPGHKGSIGVIAAYTRSFCGSCNRIRLTPYGDIQSCLYGGPVLNLRDMLRSGINDNEIRLAIQNAVYEKQSDGFAAEALRKKEIHPSMATIGG